MYLYYTVDDYTLDFAFLLKDKYIAISVWKKTLKTSLFIDDIDGSLTPPNI
jgi:hypothetical protein